MFKSLYNNKWLNLIPFENPWVGSFVASLIGATVMGALGFVLLLISGGIPDASFTSYLSLGSIGFVALFVICFVACMLDFPE